MRRRRQAGNTLIIIAVSLTALMGFLGLGIDMGVVRYERRLQQTAADGAAVAGAEEIAYSSGSGVPSASEQAASDNGFADTSGSPHTGCPPFSPSSIGTVVVTVNYPPQCDAYHNGDQHYVEVYVTKLQRTYFMSALKVNSVTVTARAVATMTGSSGSESGCDYQLGVGIGGDVTASGTPTLDAINCGINDDGGLTSNGHNVNIDAGYVGVSLPKGYVNNGGGTITPTPVVGVPPIGDPLSFLPTPSSGSAQNWNNNPVPGTTYNSVDIEGSGGNGKGKGGGGGGGSTTVNFPAGNYYINGNLTINGNVTVTGTGVTLFVTGSITINGTSTVELSAPDTGTYAGILFYDTSTNTAKLDGTNTSYYQGALYFPNAELDFGGTNLTNVTCTGSSQSNCAQYTIIVSDSLVLHGTNTLNLGSNYSSLPGGVSIIKNAVLVE